MTTVWDFIISFFVLFAVLTVIVVALVFRSKGVNAQNDDLESSELNQETIVVREIVKIRCRYCGSTYDQGLDNCPNCGAGA